VKATLKFSLPDESEEFHHACKAVTYYVALCDLREAFHRKAKYASEDEAVTWETVRDLFWDMLRESGIEGVD
jgi:hypothetical protein